MITTDPFESNRSLNLDLVEGLYDLRVRLCPVAEGVSLGPNCIIGKIKLTFDGVGERIRSRNGRHFYFRLI